VAGGTENFDPIRDLTELGREAEALARRVQVGQRAAADASARDESEQVRVVLGKDGRIADVELTPLWRRSLRADALGSAVLAAYQEAGRRRVEAWADAIGQDRSANVGDADGRVTPDTDPAAVVSTADAGPTSANAVEYARGLWYIIQDVGDRMGDLESQLENLARGTTRGQNAGENVAVSATGDRITEVVIDERWLAGADHIEIGRALNEAVRSVYTAVDRAAADSLAGQWPFADLQRVSGDPTQMLRSLGLPVPDSLIGKGHDNGTE
jgi:DNA-binding protein YbaB